MKRREFISEIGRAGAVGIAAANFRGAVRAASAKDRIKIGQIGTGHGHADGKMRSLTKNSDYEVVGVAENDPKLRAQAKQRSAYQGVPWMSEEDLLNVPGLNAVAVETKVGDLLAVAERCINAGLHIHLDKPAGANLEHFKRIVAEAKRKKRIIQMGYMFRYNPAFEFCFNAIRDGWIGNVFSLDAVISKKSGQSTRDEVAKYSGGTMFELGCHVIDAALYVLGKPTSVFAFSRQSYPQRDSLADNTLAVLEYPKVTATIRSALIEVDGFARRQFVVCGDRGTIDIRPLEPPKMKLALEEPRGGFQKGYQEVPLPNLPRYDKDFVDLAKVIRGEKSLEFSYQHDLEVQETVLRASGMM